MINQIVPTIFIFQGAMSMVRSFDSLENQVKKELKREPRHKELFVFYNGKADKVKMFAKQKDGDVILYKRLNKDYFHVERDGKGFKRITHINPMKLLADLRMK